MSSLNIYSYILLLLLLFQASTVYASEIVIGEGNSINLGSVDLVSENGLIKNQGTLNWGDGKHQISDFINHSSGESLAQNSSISVSQDWHNGGSFNPGTGTVNFIDSNPLSKISGFTNFYDLIVSSSTNKTIQFKEGTRQNILNNLVLNGTPGNLLNIVSSSPTQEAFLGLNESASQSIDYVYVTNNHSTLQMISPGESDINNSIQGPNVRGWFLTTFAFLVPSLNLLSILILVLITILVSKNQIKQSILGERKL